jgi:hypothetical protein
MGMGTPSSQRRIYPVAPASFIRWVNFMIGTRSKMESNAREDLHVHQGNFCLAAPNQFCATMTFAEAGASTYYCL